MGSAPSVSRPGELSDLAVVIDLRDGSDPPWPASPAEVRLERPSAPHPSPHGNSPGDRPKPPTSFTRSEPLQAGIRRLSLAHLDWAIDHLTAPGPDRTVAVHEARKALRRVRGLLRLVRDEVGKDVYQRENILLRDTGRVLSAARSLAVMHSTVADLRRRYKKQMRKRAFDDTLAVLDMRRDEEEAGVFDDHTLRPLVATLRSARARYAAVPVEGTTGEVPTIRNDFRAISPGLQRVYGRGRRRMNVAFDLRTEPAFHDWRKRVRYLRFQTEALVPTWPEVVGGLASSVDGLAELLGEEHDLAELAEMLRTDDGLGSSRSRELLRAVCEFRRRELQEHAGPIGLRIYAEAPPDFVARLGAYWTAWRP